MNDDAFTDAFARSPAHGGHPRLAEPRTKEEWRAYLIAEEPLRPEMPSFNEYLDMSTEASRRFNRARNAYHSAGTIVRTRTIDQTLYEVDRLLETNRNQPAGARPGRVIDGPPLVGKSTLVKWIGADYETKLRRTDPDAFATDDGVQYVRDYTPVVYISIGSATTPKDLSIDIAEFLNLEYRQTNSKTFITHQVLKALRIAGTELVIFDELHFLDLTFREGKLVNDHLKNLANHTAATFIYTGVDLEASGLFLEGKARSRVTQPNSSSTQTTSSATQTSGRNSLHRLTPLGIKGVGQATEWCSVIGAMEAHTALFKHRAGSLMREHWSYLHQRTGGSIASLSRLIREAAIEAVLSGAEQITRDVLDRIIIDRHAHEHYEKQLKRERKRRAAARPS